MSEDFIKLLDPQLVKPAKSANVTLISATGHKLATSKTVKIRITLGKNRMYHQFTVVPGFKHDMILGIDFLNERKAILDFENQVLIMGKSIHPLKPKPGQEKKEINLVRVAEDVDIFPRSDLQLKCFISKKKQPGEIFIVSQLPSSPCFEDEPGVLLPNAVVKVSKNRHIPWAVVNETGRFLHIKKGQVIGTAVGCKEEDLAPNVSPVQKDSDEHSDDSPSSKITEFNLDHIPSEQRDVLKDALLRNIDIFVHKDIELTTTNITEMRINTEDHPPTYQNPRRPPLAYRQELERQIQEMLAANVIRRSNSPWMSPVILVPKKDGSIRLCVDFRKLNAITIRPAASIPSADDIFFALGKSKFRTCLDLKQGFWQIPINEADKEKTAFGTDAGVFEFNRMPFGLSGSPGVFQNCMNAVLGDVRHFALAFVDDIIVFSETFEDHIKHLEAVFDKLRKANLRLKIAKCEFMKKELNYLGHIISDKGISVDPHKVSAVQNMEPPKNVREVRSFLGMTSYYRKYVPDFSKIARPLNLLTKKNAKFRWSSEAQLAFEKLKEALLRAPILAFPDIRKPFKLYTDASQYALGAVLTQEHEGQDRVIQFISHQFSEQRLKWPTIEREAFAIIYSLDKLRPIIIGTDITVFTDHKPLKHLFTSEMKNPRIQRWAIILGEYNCKIEYISGPKNVAADLMSRLSNTTVAEDLNDNEHLDWKGEGTNVNAVETNVIDNALEITTEPESQDKEKNTNPLDYHSIGMNTLKTSQKRDPEIKEIIDDLKSDKPRTDSGYFIEDGLLYHLDKGTKTRPHTRKQLVIPTSFRKMILGDAHDGYLGGHLGIEKTTDKILKSYFWPNMIKDIMNYVQTCETCNRKKLQKEKRPMLDMPMPSAPMEIVGIDTCGPFPLSDDGNKYVCTIVDHFSGWPEAWAIPDKTANTIARIILDEFIPRHGCPRTIISDQGTEYCNSLLDIVHKELRIGRIHTSSYHPQSNGKTERFHRSMNDMIQKQISENQNQWDLVLQSCLGAYRMSKNESTKHTPYFVMYGRDPVMPVDTLLQPRSKYFGEDYVPLAFERLHDAYSEVVQNMQQAREHNKNYIAKTAQSSDFKPGDLVYYFDPSVQPGNSTKLTLRWKNYYRVVSKLGEENYCIKNMQTNKSKIVHSENLRHRPEEDSWDRKYDSQRQPVRIGIQPEEAPSRVQPLRSARLPDVDQDWYRSLEAPVYVPTVEPQGDTSDSQERADEPRVQTGFEDENDIQMEQAQAPDGPSVAPDNPTANPLPSSDSGGHGSLSPPPQRLHGYNLRSSDQPLLGPLEGYNSGTDGPVSGKRRLDTSCENTSDSTPSKKPRAQLDIDCLTTDTNGQTNSQCLKQSHRSVSSSWFPRLFGLVMSAFTWFPGMM